jgi:1-acyl-sn-glycerol-3-phosphate acyltransferase
LLLEEFGDNWSSASYFDFNVYCLIQMPDRVSLNNPSKGKSKAPGRFYDLCKIVWGGIFGMTMRMKSLGLDRIPEEGGLLVAVSHVSHLDPIVVSYLIGRKISWVSRIEFYQHWLMRTVLYHGGAFQVDRKGAALPTMREGLRRLKSGEAVGIFPEGELVRGYDSVLRGAAIKRGVCLLAMRSGCPVLPVIVLGTEKLSKIGPWLPAKRGKIWVFAGQAIRASTIGNPRQNRAEFAAILEKEYVRLYAEMREHFKLGDIAP